MSVRCNHCNRDRSDEDLIDRETNGVLPCPSCNSTDLTYTVDTPDPEADDVPLSPSYPADRRGVPPRPNPPPAGRLIQVGTEHCPSCEVAHTVYGVASA